LSKIVVDSSVAVKWLPMFWGEPLVNEAVELRATLGIAMQHARSVYDSVYVALAYEQKAEFVTADEKLVNAVSGRLPVRWIGRFF